MQYEKELIHLLRDISKDLHTIAKGVQVSPKIVLNSGELVKGISQSLGESRMVVEKAPYTKSKINPISGKEKNERDRRIQ